MKASLLLIPLFAYTQVLSPVYVVKEDKRCIQNTDIRFDQIDFSKLELKFYQIGCFNHDRYRMNFIKVNNGYHINVYSYSTVDCQNLKANPENLDKLITTKFIHDTSMGHIKEILVTDQMHRSTMHNTIEINYKGAVYSFYDNDPDPKWKAYLYTLLRS